MQAKLFMEIAPSKVSMVSPLLAHLEALGIKYSLSLDGSPENRDDRPLQLEPKNATVVVPERVHDRKRRQYRRNTPSERVKVRELNDRIKEAVLTHPGSFTVREIADELGCDTQKVHLMVYTLAKANAIEAAGSRALSGVGVGGRTSVKLWRTSSGA